MQSSKISSLIVNQDSLYWPAHIGCPLIWSMDSRMGFPSFWVCNKVLVYTHRLVSWQQTHYQTCWSHRKFASLRTNKLETCLRKRRIQSLTSWSGSPLRDRCPHTLSFVLQSLLELAYSEATVISPPHICCNTNPSLGKYAPRFLALWDQNHLSIVMLL